MKKISILGSTGSVGTQTLGVIKSNPEKFKITGLTANRSIELLKKQIDKFNPKAVAVMDPKKAEELQSMVNVQVYSGMEGIIKIATLEKSDTVVNSLVGSVGVKPTIEAIRSKKNIALANKETLVVAGEIVMEEAKKNNVKVTPIDSEHSAIFQCLNGENINNVNRIIVTASGGPFKDYSMEQLEKVTVENALDHPTWKMGNKITIDCATLMNKGFEVIETHWFYGVGYDKIDVMIHPQSIIHSLVEFRDKATIAQLSFPNMELPIQYALSHPERFDLNIKELDLAEIKNLSFEKPDFEKFPCLKYAFDAGKAGGTLPAAMNAANEVAVNAFLNNKIKFLDIQKIIKKIIDEHNTIKNPDLDQILKVDIETKEETKKIILSL
jgi:1-deoxy-D-xylulose-5-phosphate reductoisomerase